MTLLQRFSPITFALVCSLTCGCSSENKPTKCSVSVSRQSEEKAKKEKVYVITKEDGVQFWYVDWSVPRVVSEDGVLVDGVCHVVTVTCHAGNDKPKLEDTVGEWSHLIADDYNGHTLITSRTMDIGVLVGRSVYGLNETRLKSVMRYQVRSLEYVAVQDGSAVVRTMATKLKNQYWEGR